MAVLPQLWGQFATDRKAKSAERQEVVAIDELHEKLAGKTFDQKEAIIMAFAASHRPNAGVRELWSEDRSVYVVLGAVGEALTFNPSASQLNIAVAGDAGRPWNAFLFGIGRPGGDVKVVTPKSLCGHLIAFAGSGGYGGLRQGEGGKIVESISDRDGLFWSQAEEQLVLSYWFRGGDHAGVV